MNDNFEKDFNLGGSVDKALNGQTQLKVGAVIKEAFQCTVKHFVSFTPAVVILLVVQCFIFYIALKLQLHDMSIILNAVQDPSLIDASLVQAFFIANFSFEVISAPIYAGASLMAMSHSAGLKTKFFHISKGLQFTIPVMLVTLLNLILQGVGGIIFSYLSLYLSVAFSFAILLICEKRMKPLNALWTSLRAINRKLFTVMMLYGLLMLMFLCSVFWFYGLGLLFVLPFFLHAKGIIYRNLFGIRLTVISTGSGNNEKISKVFDA
jgi:hypothetical protein